jgi:glycogen debranching enzyme
MNSIYMLRELYLQDDVLLQHLKLHNYDVEAVEVRLDLRFAADFADMFEIRGSARPARGELLPPRTGPGTLQLSYRGLDGRMRRTAISCDPPPQTVAADGFSFRLVLAAHADWELRVRVEAEEAERRGADTIACSRRLAGQRRVPVELEPLPAIRTSDAVLSRILERASKDLLTMISRTPSGLYPYAGIPWYCAPFGRDAAWTALQLLPWMPAVARGVLLFQATHQAEDADDFTDREPGKIFHELREGEMASLREIPFVPYFGAADSTPLFLVLLAEYVRTTGDDELLERLWPNALRALEWIRVHGDADGDGFVEYRTRSPLGLRNQAWKDSYDGISHADGSLAEPPIATCEVQGYVYRAFAGCAELAQRRGDAGLAAELERQARDLAQRIHASFWLEDEGHHALALDRDKRPCRVLTTNPGHLLWAGAVDPVSGERTARRLTSDELSSGYGLRTLSARALRFNPVSYHNGSVWPHDNAIVAEGLRRYGHLQGTFEVFDGLLAALTSSGDVRVPELYCGFQRRDNGRMTPYPVACAPQAWSSAALLGFVRILLGLRVDARSRRVCFENPVLPEWLDWIEVRRLPVLGKSMDFLTIRGRTSCAVEILEKPAELQVQVTM